MPVLVPCSMTRRSSPAEDYIWTLNGVKSLIEQQQELLRLFGDNKTVKNVDDKKVVLTKIVLKNPKNNVIAKIMRNPSKHLPEEKTIVIVPFRNRLSHLKEFIPSIYKQLTYQVNFRMSLIRCFIVNIIFFSLKILKVVTICVLGLKSFYICSRTIWILTRAFQQSKTV